jgi:hypothetical protein
VRICNYPNIIVGQGGNVPECRQVVRTDTRMNQLQGIQGLQRVEFQDQMLQDRYLSLDERRLAIPMYADRNT